MIEGLFAPWHIILILVIALVLFGPGKLPEFGRGLGRGIRDFRSAMTGIREDLQSATTLPNPEQANAKRCRACQTTLAEQARFCPKCGAAVAAPAAATAAATRPCVHCGHAISLTAAFCPECGHAQRASQPEEPSVEETA